MYRTFSQFGSKSLLDSPFEWISIRFFYCFFEKFSCGSIRCNKHEMKDQQNHGESHKPKSENDVDYKDYKEEHLILAIKGITVISSALTILEISIQHIIKTESNNKLIEIR